MKALSSTDMLRVWESAQGRSHVEKGLALLREAFPELDADTRLDMSIGRRDGYLLDMRRATFGDRFECIAACPACEERLEVEFTADDIRELSTAAPMSEYDLRWEDYEVTFRVPNSRDLWRLRHQPSVVAARRVLFQQCISAARHHGEPCDARALPEGLLDAVAGRMPALDPQAEVSMELACASCEHVWTERFDILSYLWVEVQGSVARLVAEVQELASRYGWSEESILAFSPVRRRMYLQWGHT